LGRQGARLIADLVEIFGAAGIEERDEVLFEFVVTEISLDAATRARWHKIFEERARPRRDIKSCRCRWRVAGQRRFAPSRDEVAAVQGPFMQILLWPIRT